MSKSAEKAAGRHRVSHRHKSPVNYKLLNSLGKMSSLDDSAVGVVIEEPPAGASSVTSEGIPLQLKASGGAIPKLPCDPEVVTEVDNSTSAEDEKTRLRQRISVNSKRCCYCGER